MTIHSRKYPYNMAPWLAEKSEGICESVAIVAEGLNAVDLPAGVRVHLLNNLHAALYNATKILEYAYDTDQSAWTPDEARQILEEGPEALERFLRRVKEYSDETVFEPFPRGGE